MPVTRENRSSRYVLKPGEQWVTCVSCGRILAKLLPSGDLEVKLSRNEGWVRVKPTPSARAELICTCTNPPSQNVEFLNK